MTPLKHLRLVAAGGTMSQQAVTNVESSGFYAGYNRWIAVSVKVIIMLLVLWASIAADAADILLGIQSATIDLFGIWYIGATAAFMSTSVLLALIPMTGKQRLGAADVAPEFGRFAWFSMMFGAGIGVGMLTYSTAEPLYHFGNNPDVIMGHAGALTPENVRYAYKWTLLHYGLTPWACYAVVGLSLAYFSYRKGMPLTIRSPFSALLGHRFGTVAGGFVDTAAILATVIGIAVTIGYGVSQLAYGFHQIADWDWLLDEGQPSIMALSAAVFIIIFASMLSALSGIGRGYQVAFKPQYGAVVATASGVCYLRRNPVRRGGFHLWHCRLCKSTTRDVPHSLVARWLRRICCPKRLAGELDDFLLGLVDSVYALRRPVSGASFPGQNYPRICCRRDGPTLGDVLCLVLHSRGYRFGS